MRNFPIFWILKSGHATLTSSKEEIVRKNRELKNLKTEFRKVEKNDMELSEMDSKWILKTTPTMSIWPKLTGWIIFFYIFLHNQLHWTLVQAWPVTTKSHLPTSTNLQQPDLGHLIHHQGRHHLQDHLQDRCPQPYPTICPTTNLFTDISWFLDNSNY